MIHDPLGLIEHLRADKEQLAIDLGEQIERAIMAEAEIERLRTSISELLAAIEDYDNGRNDRGEAGRIGRLLQLRRETGIAINEQWMPDAVRVWKALDRAKAYPASSPNSAVSTSSA